MKSPVFFQRGFVIFGLGLLLYFVFFIRFENSGSPTVSSEASNGPDEFRWTNGRGVRANKAFNATWVPFLDSLGLLSIFLDDDEKFATDLEDSKTVIVTAFSDSHFYGGCEMLASIQKYEKKLSRPPLVYFYNMGLSEEKQFQLGQNFSFLKIRNFSLDNFPEYVSNLYEYRWKPLIVAEFYATTKHKNFWWFDASVRIRNDGDLRWYHRDYIESGGDWKVQYPLILNHYTSHSIFAATHPDTYDYFPIDESHAKATPMYGAGVFGAFRRGLVAKNILKWWVLCALEQGCMAPVGSFNGCVFSSDEERRNSEYACCHRFDQSVLNILVADANGYNTARYFRDKALGEGAVHVRRS